MGCIQDRKGCLRAWFSHDRNRDSNPFGRMSARTVITSTAILLYRGRVVGLFRFLWVFVKFLSTLLWTYDIHIVNYCESYCEQWLFNWTVANQASVADCCPDLKERMIFSLNFFCWRRWGRVGNLRSTSCKACVAKPFPPKHLVPLCALWQDFSLMCFVYAKWSSL